MLIEVKMAIRTLNPATGELIKNFDALSDAEIDSRLQLASDTFRTYRHVPFAEKSPMMRKACEILEADKQKLARIMTLEMGKPIGAAVQEVEKCALACDFYANNAERSLADEKAQSSANRSYVKYQPLGPVLAIMPWNFPLWQCFRFAAPGLMAGNVGLLKHASNVPQCALAIEEVFRRAGFPEGAFQTLLIGSDKVDQIIADPRVVAVTLTGSVGAGSSVASSAGKQIKKTVLELGGSDPFIVMPSANMKRTIETAVQARTVNNGQSCIAAKRFIVHERVADEFLRGFVERMKALKVGDPMDETIEIGPLATKDVLDDLDEQVQATIKAGARALCGGRKDKGTGFFYMPTVLTDIPKESPAYREELFGPVASVFRARNIEEAIDIANDTKFGLGSSLWSNDEDERQIFIDRIEAGMAFINGMVASDPRIPFGGVKQSGYGRELSVHGIREFVNAKTVCINEMAKGGSATE
jgi:succinate-semialdehyde dehydrogenase / glutarate-semialdehyde dehydrogenase